MIHVLSYDYKYDKIIKQFKKTTKYSLFIILIIGLLANNELLFYQFFAIIKFSLDNKFIK